jgi:hypothetical protein
MPDGGSCPAAPPGPRGDGHRPPADGTQASFMPFPTPVFDAAGVFIAAVNLLVDITGWPERERCLREARRCRRLARTVTDAQTIESLEAMAKEYEAKARECVFEGA